MQNSQATSIIQLYQKLITGLLQVTNDTAPFYQQIARLREMLEHVLSELGDSLSLADQKLREALHYLLAELTALLEQIEALLKKREALNKQLSKQAKNALKLQQILQETPIDTASLETLLNLFTMQHTERVSRLFQQRQTNKTPQSALQQKIAYQLTWSTLNWQVHALFDQKLALMHKLVDLQKLNHLFHQFVHEQVPKYRQSLLTTLMQHLQEVFESSTILTRHLSTVVTHYEEDIAAACTGEHQLSQEFAHQVLAIQRTHQQQVTQHQQQIDKVQQAQQKAHKSPSPFPPWLSRE
jgi:hypothetical protein